MARRVRKLKEVKAEKKMQERKARRRKRAWFLVVELMVFCILLGAFYVIQKYDKFQGKAIQKKDIEINKGVKQEGYTTIALFGGDSREGALEEGTHADTIMVAVIDHKTKEVKMVSLYRDTLCEQKDGEYKKANSAYFFGGPKDAINMLNKNYDLDIENYVTVDFKALADTIDLLGGIEVDVTEAEVKATNEYIWETASVTGKPGRPLTQAGVQKLDGVQATTYARIRKNVGGDYKRTERQRLVIQKVVEKVKATDLVTINQIINTVFPQVSTSFTLKDLIGLAAGALDYKLGETSGFPFESTDGSLEGVGSIVIPLGIVENVEELHAFLYPKDEYEVSDKVKEIAKRVERITGYSRDDYKDENQTSGNEE